MNFEQDLLIYGQDFKPVYFEFNHVLSFNLL